MLELLPIPGSSAKSISHPRVIKIDIPKDKIAKIRKFQTSSKYSPIFMKTLQQRLIGISCMICKDIPNYSVFYDGVGISKVERYRNT